MASSGYPHGFSANNSKAEYVAKGLMESGMDVTMLDEIFGSSEYDKMEYGVSDTGIPYYILPKRGHKLKALPGNIKLVWRILKDKRIDDGNHLLLSMEYYPFYFLIIVIASLLGYKRSALFHEWHVGFSNLPLWKKIEANLRDRTFGFFLDLLFPISHFLVDKSKHFRKPFYLLPILGDFSRIPTEYDMKDHFAYCCSAEYLLRCSLVLDAFKKLLVTHPHINLIIILTGYYWKKKEVDTLVQTYNLGANITIKTKIPQEELFQIYDSSIGLLIPLDPNSLQDKARFSQKIAEYVATKRPIITSNVGEIPYYFKSNVSAMVVNYTADEYSEAMLKLCDDTAFADYVGINGYKVGVQYFDYKKVGKDIAEAIRNL